MTRHSRRNSRAMRRQRTARLQSTIDGLQAEHRRAGVREAQAREALQETSTKLRQTDARLAEAKRELEALRAGRGQLVDSALQLVNMVRTETIGRPATFSNMTPRGLHPDQWRFMLRERHFDARQLTAGNDPAKIDLIDYTMHVLRKLPTVRDTLNCQIHLRFRLGDGQAGYALSDAAIRQGDEAVLVERISEELALMLLRELRGHARPSSERRLFGY